MRTDSESGYESQDSREPSNSHGRCGKSKSKGEKKYVTKAKKKSPSKRRAKPLSQPRETELAGLG
jgi:hypothetical protein